MAKITVGMIFLTDPSDADSIISDMQQQHNIEMLHVETSYSKLWVVHKDSQGGQHD